MNALKVGILHSRKEVYEYFLSQSSLLSSLDLDINWQHQFELSLDEILVSDILFCEEVLVEEGGLNNILQASGFEGHLVLFSDKIADSFQRGGVFQHILTEMNYSHQALEQILLMVVEKRTTEQQLQTKEKQIHSLFANSIDAVYRIDLQAKLRSWNQKLESLTGYESSQLNGKSIGELFSTPEDYQRFLTQMDNNKDGTQTMAKIKSATGRTIEVLLTCAPILQDSGRIVAFQGVMHDLTSMRHAERELQIAQKLSMTGRIARSIAHEVRNPLTNINLAVDQFEELPLVDEEARMYIDIIRRNAGRIEELVQQLLKSAKPEGLKLQVHDIRNAVDAAIRLIRDRLVLKRINLVKNTGEQPLFVAYDQERMVIAILNILVNALEAVSQDTGVISIDLSSDTSGMVCLEVSDNGVGIGKEDISRLFDPFFTGKPDGTGLGLTTTQSIMNAHKGSIEVESNLGQGSSFKVYLPEEVTTPS